MEEVAHHFAGDAAVGLEELRADVEEGDFAGGGELGEKHAHCMVCNSGFDLRKPAPVGQFPANPYGLFDTAGNLEEWVADCYKDSYKGAPVDGTAVDRAGCRQRVVRGGAFSSGPRGLRATTRSKFNPNGANDSLGFRVVREVDAP